MTRTPLSAICLTTTRLSLACMQGHFMGYASYLGIGVMVASSAITSFSWVYFLLAMVTVQGGLVEAGTAVHVRCAAQ